MTKMISIMNATGLVPRNANGTKIATRRIAIKTAIFYLHCFIVSTLYKFKKKYFSGVKQKFFKKLCFMRKSAQESVLR